MMNTIAFITIIFTLLQHFCKAAYPRNQVPYTLYQLPLQKNFSKNQAAIRGTIYEPYFRPDLFVYPEMIVPGREPINCNTEAMHQNFSDIGALLVPASIQLKNENAWCAYDSGQGFVASRSHWPGVTAEMVQWWMWWHTGGPFRYTLWHPWAHISVTSTYAQFFNDPNYNSTQKLVGSIHHVKEIIGELSQDIEIHWQRPSYFGLDESKFNENGIVASACGEIYVAHAIKSVDMIHLWYRTKGGLELRSRYFLASQVQVREPLLKSLPIDSIANMLKIKKLIVGPELSYLQFHHDQQEMTHLAGLLPELYAAFSNTSSPTVGS